MDRTLEWIMNAKGGDRELDGLLAIAFEGYWTAGRLFDSKAAFCRPSAGGTRTEYPGPDPMELVPHYTASLDEALALAERVMPGVWFALAKGRMTGSERLFHCQLSFGLEALAAADADTAPMAVIAALLLANPAKDIDPR